MNDTEKQRLFVDMDGTLAVFTPVDELETLYEQGYFLNQAPHENVVEAIRHIINEHPEVEVNILSAYLTDSHYALKEKNEWLDKYLPEIDSEHRVFVPCGSNKKDGIVGGVRPNDFLLDDYTLNLNEWQPPARGIKLLNGINHTRGSWQHDRIRYDRESVDLADSIVSLMKDERRVFDEKVNEESEADEHMAQERAGLDEYRQQVQTIYEYEVENNIPENDRMTKWYDEMNISVAKPWYKENDPSVMDRAVGSRYIPISESSIAMRYAEIVKEQQEKGYGELEMENEREKRLAEDIHEFLSEYSEEYLGSDEEVFLSALSGDMYEYAEQLDEIRSQAFEGYNDKLLLTQLDDDTREMVERLDSIRKDMVLLELDHERLVHEEMYDSKEVAITLMRDFDFTEEHIKAELTRREYNRVDAENRTDLVSESETLYDYSDRLLNEVLSEMQRIERNNNALEVGSVIEYNGKYWEVESLDFISNFNNINKEDNEQSFSYIGGVENFIKTHDFRVLDSEEIDKIKSEKEENFRFFYSYEIDQAREMFNSHRENNWHWLVGDEEHGFNGNSILIYRNISDLPEWVQGYAREYEAKLEEMNTQHYYEPELEIEGTSQDMYNNVRRNYITNPDTLTRLEEILRSEGKDDMADMVSYYNGELSEEGNDYSINRMKIDFLDSRALHHSTGGGLDDFTIHEADGERASLSVFYEPSNDTVLISVNEITAEYEGVGATSVSLDEFLKFTKSDFDRTVGEVIAYGMERTEFEREEERQIVPIKEFVDNDGYIYDGQSISYFHAMQENRVNEHGFYYGDRSYVYNAVRDFEEANDIKNRAIEEDGSYLDKDILYSAYDEYVGMSHYEEMQAKYGEYVTPLAERNATYAKSQNEEHGYSMSTDPIHYASNLYAELYYAEKRGLSPEQIKLVIDYMNIGDSPYTSSRAETMKHASALLRSGKSEEFVSALATKDYSTRDSIISSLQYAKTPEQESILAKANSMESAHGIASFFIEVNRNIALDPNRENEKAEIIMDFANRFSERDEGKSFSEKWDIYASEMLGDFALGVGNTDGYTLSADELRFIGERMITEDKFYNPEEVKALVTEERNKTMAEQKENSHRDNGENTAGREKMSKETQDRQKRVNELRNMVVQGVEAVRSDENYKAWLRTRSHNFMNKYSFGNILRVAFQNPTASTVMGYEQWKDYGRQVNAGAKGMQILVPMFYQEKTSGNLCRDIMASLTNQLKTKESAEYKLGETGIKFSMNRGSSEIGLSLPNGASVTFANRQELNTFLQKNIIGKTPRYYNPQSVFDVTDTSTPNLLSVKRGFKDSELIRGKGVDVPIENADGLVLAKAKFSKEPDAPKGYEWVDKNEIGKGTWELVSAPQGEPVKVGRKGEEFLIVNTDERKAKFHDMLEMNVIAKNPEVMKTLFEAIKGLSEDKGVPVKVVSKESDEWQTSKEANGYFHRAEGVEKANYPKGFIVIPTELLQEKPAHAVKTLVHEMAHADLHGEIAKLEKEMGMSVSREMKETQAESVAFMVCENFGIDSSDYSFKYLATWASDEELKAFTKSLNVIDREAQQLVSEINAKLETLGLDRELRELPKEVLSKETVETKVNLYNKEISDNRDLIISQNDELAITAEQSRDNSDKADIVILMKDNLEKRQHEVELQRDLIDSLECADTREMQDEIMAELDTSLYRSSNLSKAFDDYRTSLETISLRNREGLREQFAQNPLSTLGKMGKENYPELLSLSGAQKQYIAKSPYVRETLTPLLATDPQRFVSEIVKRANDAMKVASKTGMFVEVISCKQTTEPPILKNGDLAHPKVADKIVGEAEMQIRDIKRNSDFFPNADTRLGIYSFTEKGNISCYVANLRIGDSTQVNLMDYLKKACPNKGELINVFESATKEKGAKEKLISVGEISHGENERGIEDTKERMTMEQAEAEIKELKEAGARERAESGKDNETQDKSAKPKDERGE